MARGRYDRWPEPPPLELRRQSDPLPSLQIPSENITDGLDGLVQLQEAFKKQVAQEKHFHEWEEEEVKHWFRETQLLSRKWVRKPSGGLLPCSTASVKRAGLLRIFKGASSQCYSTLGFGDFEPQVVSSMASIDQCAVVPLHPGEPPLVVTIARDGGNLLWSSEFSVLSNMPFYSACQCEFEPMVKKDETKLTGKTWRKDAERAKKEQEALRIQGSHLCLSREQFISNQMHTTVLHPVHFGVAKHALHELEQKEALFDLVENDVLCTRSHLPKKCSNGRRQLDAPRQPPKQQRQGGAGRQSCSSTPGNITARRMTSPLQPPSKQKEPTARNLRTRRQSTWDRRGDVALTFFRPEGKPAFKVGQDSPGIFAIGNKRQHVHVTCVSAHANLPRLAVGISDGQLSVYHIYRAHGHRKHQLHQTQGFDGSRANSCDVPTAVFVPEAPLEQDGSMNVDSFIVGFASGRVAVFAILLPEAVGRVKFKSSHPISGELPECRPVLTDREPLLMEHFVCTSQVHSLMWHPILGVLSVHSDGTALIVDTNGNVSCTISSVVGPNVLGICADLSLEHEQLAVAGQRAIHLWQCFSQAQMGVLQVSSPGGKRSTSLTHIVRYLPSQNFLVSAHELQAELRLWDVLKLELVSSVSCPECIRATSATWDRNGMRMLVFGPVGVVTYNVKEDNPNEEEIYTTFDTGANTMNRVTSIYSHLAPSSDASSTDSSITSFSDVSAPEV